MPSIPTEALLDVNVIVASVFADHVMHLPARRFIESLERVYTTPTVQGGFLRFATLPLKNERGDEPRPRLKMSEALAKLQEFTGRGHVFVSDDVPFTNLRMRSMQGHRQWTDAYLLHIARKHGLICFARKSNGSLDDSASPTLFVVR
jgi:predicted nucleic acid-binding protein